MTIALNLNVRDDLKHHTVADIVDVQSDASLPYAVCALNITGDLNVGMMMRSACILGAEQFIIYGLRRYDRRSTVGVQNYIPVLRVEGREDETTLDPVKFHVLMEELGYFPVFVEQGGTPLHEMDWSFTDKKICLVFGNEGDGIPTEFTTGNQVVSVPQRGVTRSFNVSAAAAIVAHDLVNRKFGW